MKMSLSCHLVVDVWYVHHVLALLSLPKCKKEKILPFFLNLKMCFIITGCNNIVLFKCTVVMFKCMPGLWSVTLLVLKVNFDLICILLYFVTVFITSILFKSKCYCKNMFVRWFTVPPLVKSFYPGYSLPATCKCHWKCPGLVWPVLICLNSLIVHLI